MSILVEEFINEEKMKADLLHRLVNTSSPAEMTSSGFQEGDYLDNNQLEISEFFHFKRTLFPEEIQTEINRNQSNCNFGMIPLISRAWVSVDSNLFLWNFKTNNDLALFDSLTTTIQKIELVNVKPNFFEDTVKFLLVIVTTEEIVLFAVSFASEHGGLLKITKGFSDPNICLTMQELHKLSLDGLVVNQLHCTQNGRIFFASEDNLYELTYYFDMWNNRVYKHVNLTKGFFSGLMSAFVSKDSIRQIECDNSRHILYTLSAQSKISVYDLGERGNDFSYVTSYSINSLQQKIGNCLGIDRELLKEITSISAVPSTQSISGARVYFTCSNDVFFEKGNKRVNQSAIRPVNLKPIHFRCSPIPVSNYQSDTFASCYTKIIDDVTVIVLGSPVSNIPSTFAMSASNFPHLSRFSETRENLLIEHIIWSIESESTQQFEREIIKGSELVPSTQLSAYSRQHIDRQVIFHVVTAQGIDSFVHKKPVELLFDLLEKFGLESQQLKQFLTMHDSFEICVMALILLSNDTHYIEKIKEAAFRLFTVYGGQPANRSRVIFSYFARIVYPIWHKRICTVKNVLNVSGISIEEVREVLQHVIGLTRVIEVYNLFVDVHRGEKDLTKVYEALTQEKRSVGKLYDLMNLTQEYLALWQIILENNKFHVMIVNSSSELQTQLQNLTFSQLIAMPESVGFELISTLTHSYLNDEIEIEAFNERLSNECPTTIFPSGFLIMEVDRSFSGNDHNSSFHFLENDDIVVKVSQAIFDDFHSLVTADLSFADITKSLYEICNNGVESIRKLSAGIRKGDPTLQSILGQLCEERNAYLLLWMLLETERSVENKRPTTNSLLQNLLIKDVEFRKLHALLKWVENKDFHQPHGTQLSTWTRSQDLELVLTTQTTLKPQYEESITQLFQLILAYVRCGRLDEAIDLANQSGCFTLAGLIDTRSALFETELSPTNIAVSLLNMLHVRRSQSHLAQLQQCTWAALSGDLSPLLTYANCTDDRLWAYLNSAVEHLFDENITRNSDKKFFNDDDSPKSVGEIFDELFRSEKSAIYQIYGYLSTAEFEKIDEVLARQISEHETPPAHVSRFYAHLVLLLKFMGKGLSTQTVDKVICQFVNVLISLSQFVLAPYYLSQVSEEVRKNEMIFLLRNIGNENVRKEVLFRAAECGIDSSEICLAVYQQVKDECVFTGNENKITKSASELLRAWRWLTYNGTDTIYDALVEANYIIRKLFVLGRRAELVELIQLAGNDLPLEVEKAYNEESSDVVRKPFELEKAQREYQGYVEFFEATEAYNMWRAHIEKPIPQLPTKLTDENWARLDMKRRAEYELSLQEARDSRRRYEQISESLRTNAVTLLENILKRAEEWLIAVGGQFVEENEASEENDESLNEIQKLRGDYLYDVINALISVHQKAGDHDKILNISRLIVDTKYNIHQYLRKAKLRKILKIIAKSGSAILST
ncbi:Nuclear pore complex protein [Aphelenchoides bicaudatus]|nr:Nuclear pore complex protein [Aphelenchoides bicaudatus]